MEAMLDVKWTITTRRYIHEQIVAQWHQMRHENIDSENGLSHMRRQDIT